MLFKIVLISFDINVYIKLLPRKYCTSLYRSIQKNEAFESRIPPIETLAKLIKECVIKKFAHFSMDGEQKFVRLFKDR